MKGRENISVIKWNGEDVSSYVLGTAQLGMDYGVANKTGCPDQEMADNIVAAAGEGGCRVFDTAQGYGRSESVLGEALSKLGLRDVKVLTKLDPAGDPSSPGWIEEACEGSLSRVRVESFWCVMLHRSAWLDLWSEELGHTMNMLLRNMKAKHLGVSVYGVDEFDRVLECKEMEIIQCPCNLWDPCIFSDRWPERFKEEGRLVLARSIFLQGLMLMEPEEVQARLPVAFDAAIRWQGICKEMNMTAYGLCMRFAAALCSNGFPVVLGAEDASQAAANSEALCCEPLSLDDIKEITKAMAGSLGPDVTNPSMWKVKA